MEDAIYLVSMTLFATIPLQGMRAPPSARHTHAPKWTAIVAFLLLLVLQFMKQYSLGVVMVMLNLSVRLLELWHELSKPARVSSREVAL